MVTYKSFQTEQRGQSIHEDGLKGKYMLNHSKTGEDSFREGPKKQSTPLTFLHKGKLSEPSVLV